MYSLEKQSENTVSIEGKLLEVEFREGVTKTKGVPYVGGNVLIGVQSDDGSSYSEIRVDFFAQQITSKGLPNAGYGKLQELKQYSGVDNKPGIRVNSANIKENAFLSRSGQLINTWRVDGRFFDLVQNPVGKATFKLSGVIRSITPEVTAAGEETGRLVVKLAVVQWAGAIDLLTLYVADPAHCEHVQRLWNAAGGETVSLGGVVETREVSQSPATDNSIGGFGEMPSQSYSRTELIITGGSPPADEDYSWNLEEIKRGLGERKAKLDEMTQGATAKATAPAPASVAPSTGW